MTDQTNDNKLWLLIQNQLPDFMRHDESYSRFLAFVEAYYKFLQEVDSNNPLELVSNAEQNRDIDKTLDEFVEHFTKSLMDGFPVVYDTTETVPSVKLKKRQQIKRVVKNTNDLFISKSVEAAYRNLFRVLYDEEITLFYPKTVILKASDGRWQEDVTVKIFVTSGDLTAFDLTYGSAQATEYAGSALTGAIATVESITATAVGEGILYELFLNKASITKPTRAYSDFYQGANPGASAPRSFMSGNTVKVMLGALEVEGTIQEVTTAITITTTTGGYTTSSPLTVMDNGVAHPIATVEVKSVDDNGKIKAINVLESGYSFTGPVTIEDDASNVVATVEISGLTYYPGRFLEVNGFLSDQIKIRGPKPSKLYPNGHIPEEYYQEFSYVIKSSVAISTWRDVVKRILHPTGYAVFGEVDLLPSSEQDGRALLGLFNRNTDDVNDPEINGNGGFLYHLLQLLLLQFVTVTPQTAAELTISPMFQSMPTNLLGPTYWSIDSFKSVSPAYQGGTTPYGGTTIDSDAVSAALYLEAWDPDFEGNTPVSAIGDLVLGDFYDGVARTKKTNICPDPYMIYRVYP